jgi:hypothetical protein
MVWSTRCCCSPVRCGQICLAGTVIRAGRGGIAAGLGLRSAATGLMMNRLIFATLLVWRGNDALVDSQQLSHRRGIDGKGEDGRWFGRQVGRGKGHVLLNRVAQHDHATRPQVLLDADLEEWKCAADECVPWIDNRHCLRYCRGCFHGRCSLLKGLSGLSRTLSDSSACSPGEHLAF